MSLNLPLIAKDPSGRPQVLGIGRISTEHQPLSNIDASKAYVLNFLDRTDSGNYDMTFLGERASGMLVDRETITQAMELIESGKIDLVITEELSRIYRNPQFQFAFAHLCVDTDTRLICIGDNIDTATDNWEVSLQAAVLRHGLFIPDTRRRVNRTSSDSFKKGGMVQKIRFGYRKLTKEEAASGQFGPVGLRIAKLNEQTSTIMLMREMVLAKDVYAGIEIDRWSLEDISDHLNRNGIAPGPYAKLGKWTAAMVKGLLSDEILWGRRTFRRYKFKQILRTGKYRRKFNPNPETEPYDCLAHMTRAEFDVLQLDLQRRECEAKRSEGFVSPRRGVRRGDSFWPGQHAVCEKCGDQAHRYDDDQLKCRNAHQHDERHCWNHVQIKCDVVRDKFFSWLDKFTRERPNVRATILDSACSAMESSLSASRKTQSTAQDEITRLEKERTNLTKAIRKGGRITSLVKELQEVETEIEKHLTKSRKVEATASTSYAKMTRNELDCHLKEAMVWLAETSYEFASFLRRIIPVFHYYPVQALDSGLVRPRGLIIVDFGRLIESDQASSEGDHLRVELTFDLFEPPVHIRHLNACLAAKAANAKLSYKKIAQSLSSAEEVVTAMTVKRAFCYARLMALENLSVPYRVLTSRPGNASRWVAPDASQADVA